jgi:L-threonylcarbamoyladenylate synthase
MLNDYISYIPDPALDLISNAKKPTTIIYPGARNLADNLLAKDGSVGIRIPSDTFCQALIRLTGKPIVSTSANLSGEPSPSLFGEISQKILQEVDHVVNWRQDETEAALPSAIIKVGSDGKISIIRS